MTSNDGGRDEKSQKLSHVKDEFKGDVNVVVGNGPRSQRISKIDGNVKAGGDLAVVRRNSVSQEPLPQQQPQGSLSHWDRFLHVGSIKVLLVENDDSTRHIVTALLRNCNYEVIEAANGFQAWKILEDLSNHIDIVLTEVVMPSLSGIALLCKIMSHKTRKNIPVIMMSSHDSMGLVFKCLSKGAADFLLKPIRKNELKNLWQHVWRRCQSSSGSGSESATNAQKSVNSKRSDSMIKDDIGSSHDGSDDGSGTQSSWTKQAVELDSSQAASPCDQTTEHPDSTCGVVIRSAETPATKDYENQEVQEDNVGKGNGLVVEGSRDSKLQISQAVMAPNVHNGIEHFQDFDTTKMIRDDDFINMNAPRLVNGEFEAQKEPKHILDTNTKVIIDDSRETITELSLKRPRESKGVKNGLNVLRHSELSAFTRYTTTSNATRTGITSSGFQLDNRSESMKKESTRNAHSDGFLIYQGLNEQAVAAKSGDILPPDSLNPPQVDHIHHHHHHHVHHYHHIGQKQPSPSNHEDSGRHELAEGAPHCGSSNVLGGAVEVNIENCSLNRSGSGSKHGSNGQNGSSTAVTLQGKNVESGGDLIEKTGSGGGENGVDQHKSTQREAALIKFREKRKDRCFQKKVRYQNRKLLAEQRPRFRGQFVKQTGRESSSNAEDP